MRAAQQTLIRVNKVGLCPQGIASAGMCTTLETDCATFQKVRVEVVAIIASQTIDWRSMAGASRVTVYGRALLLFGGIAALGSTEFRRIHARLLPFLQCLVDERTRLPLAFSNVQLGFPLFGGVLPGFPGLAAITLGSLS